MKLTKNDPNKKSTNHFQRIYLYFNNNIGKNCIKIGQESL